MLSSLALVPALFLVSAFAATEPRLIEAGSHCVAYKVQKTMFLIKSDTVVGRNCEVSAQVLPEIGGLYRIEVNVPVRSFNSGDPDRDKDVLKLLHAQDRADLTFRSGAFSREQWRQLFAKKDFQLEGRLYIGNEAYPVTLNVEYNDRDALAEVRGEATVKFTDFAMKPPRVGGGLVAKSKPEFQLLFNLVSNRILGADSIRLGMKDSKQ